MRGLVAYDDDPSSDHEDQTSPSHLSVPPTPSASTSNNVTPASTSGLTSNGSQLNTRSTAPSDQVPTRSLNTSSSSKPAVIIRRHAPAKPHLRTRVPDDARDEAGSSNPAVPRRSASQEVTGSAAGAAYEEEASDELARVRQLLHPPPIPGVVDWGIPPEPETPCDEAIKAKITQFLALKRDPHNPRHFNDSLMSNRAFRNPHLYAKLVEFVDVDERTTNFPKHIWDPMDVKEEWYADRIAEEQKARSEATAAAQSSSKRSHIDFASSSKSTTSSHNPRHPHPDMKHSRFQPYNIPPLGEHPHKLSSGGGVLGGGYGKGRGRSRWG
ncbi:hypothetical protein BN946_scf185006.g11 [Trametes cinnabarina]|uniref:HCNGP-like protein n=1 Tax=Pycnoporus cinnabarinus TaxID=5643 RepID=A0A060SXG7_PYCCI|nr:hypothetical protein BN946_scf185006.g11 [Trametes cinnabarina]